MGDRCNLKLHIWFRIKANGHNDGIVLPRYYNVKAQQDGTLYVGPRSALSRELCNVGVTETGFVSPDAFAGKLVRVRVCDVTSDAKGDVLRRDSTYLKIQAVLGRPDTDLSDSPAPSRTRSHSYASSSPCS